MTPRDRCLGLVDELYAEAAEFLRPAAECVAHETDGPADAARAQADRDVGDTETGGERLAAH